jgi:N-acyl-D-amino-acid deacylase
VGKEDESLFKTAQGITTEFCGNCGSSVAPMGTRYLEQNVSEIGAKYSVEEKKKWSRFEGFLRYAEQCRLTSNCRFYVGHGQLRRCVMGTENRPATGEELEEMKALLRDALASGAAGMSTGLIYVPGCYAATDEVLELAKELAPFDGIYTSHIRNESEAVIEAVDEVLEIGKRAGVRVNISHHKVQGRGNWGKQNITLEKIHRANDEGYATTLDLYPYLRSMNVMTSCIPGRHLAQGRAALVEKLSDPAFRMQLREEMQDPNVKYDNFYRNAGGWEGVMIAYADQSQGAAGLTVAEYARRLGKDPFETYFDLLRENMCVVGGVYETMEEEGMNQIARSPYCVIGTDGCSPSWKHHGHPRASAAFPQAIQYFVKDKKIFTLEEMIHKMTGLTATRLTLPQKGFLKDGYDADVLIFDYEGLRVNADYLHPHCLTDGIHRVIVGGQVVFGDLKFTGVYSGRVIRYGK